VNSTASPQSIAIYGHESADPEAVAHAFGGRVMDSIDPQMACAIFVINPAMGIDQATIDLWRSIDEYQTPRIVVVTQLENQEADFDDAVMLANRVFDHVATPYLVLHDDAGIPCALISLETMRVSDYTTFPPLESACEPEHETLVQEFRDEYLELSTSMGEGAFAAGLLFPAIPLWIHKGIGVDIVNEYLNQIKD
jgi:translation elongation factor EF-G